MHSSPESSDWSTSFIHGELILKMLQVHKNIIISNLTDLVERTNLNALVPELLLRGVFNSEMIDRILNPKYNEKNQKTSLYTEILKRGPKAFENLKNSLIASNHLDLANTLQFLEIQELHRAHHRNLLNTVGPYENSNDGEAPFGQCAGAGRLAGSTSRVPEPYLPTTSAMQTRGYPEVNSSRRTSGVNDCPRNRNNAKRKVFAAPSYGLGGLQVDLNTIKEILSVYELEKNRPVVVRQAINWPVEEVGKPKIYKMDSNPRGLSLVINNRIFVDKAEYPDRIGSENDVIRIRKLLAQLHFEVEFHENKTKAEMEEIVQNFSKNPKLNNIDCAWLIIMSHGEEGNSPEDTEIIGVDGLCYKSEHIVRLFYNNDCAYLINKPKLFFFHVCRGILTDPGVNYTIGGLNLSSRVDTDGRKVTKKGEQGGGGGRIRSHSDIFVAYPTHGGYMANRDNQTGTWFIQAVVDVFSAHSHNNHLEDLLKMVDFKIKEVNNISPWDNFQAVSVKLIGWNKQLYFNPGLCRDADTGITTRIAPIVESEEAETDSDSAEETSADEKDQQDGSSHRNNNFGCFGGNPCGLI